MALQHLRASTADKRPTPAAMADGQLAMNTNLASPGLFFKDSNGDLVKTGPVHVGTTAPNATPASGGQAGNSKGELWLDTTGTDYTLKTWDGSAWREIVVTSTMIKDGTIVNADINASAAIVDTKLATIATAGKVSNSATTATNANTASAIVARDGSGNFTAGTITAALTGAASANVLKAGDTMTGVLAVTAGTAALPAITPSGDPNTGIFSPGADQVAISTNGTGRLFVDAAGNVGVGDNPFNANGKNLEVAAVDFPRIHLNCSGSGGRRYWMDSLTTGSFSITDGTASQQRLVIDSSGRLGLGTSNPSYKLDVSGDFRNSGIYFNQDDTPQTIAGTISRHSTVGLITRGITASVFDWSVYSAGGTAILANPTGTNKVSFSGGEVYFTGGNVGIGTTSPGSALEINAAAATSPFIAKINTAEVARIDSSGRLLVGTSTSRGDGSPFQVVNDSANAIEVFRGQTNAFGTGILLGKSRGTTASPTVVSSGDQVGVIAFKGYSGAASAYVDAALISAEIDGTPDSSGDTTDMPGRLVFSTTADGASSPTEAMRITSAGNLLVGGTSTSGYRAEITSQSSTTLLIARVVNDGNLIDFVQGSTIEGSISVSGTTITYGGGHLARWSQLPNEEDPSSLLKGTVMSNLDEMCEWGEEDNEQLNKTKVSNVEGDPNVAGVFVSTSFSDDGPLDFFVAMTGDMIIRIAEGVTVQRGDLLMSAGDGTAKPQDDDIIRSKTIAKVTSTHVTCTYDDGSYCVPCVLMAC
jgi:hypothetical protein